MRFWRQAVVAIGCGIAAGPLLAGPAARAQTAAPANRVEVNIIPYMWLAGLSGSVTTHGRDLASVHQNFNDVLSHLNAAVMTVATLRYNRWVAMIDFDYVNMSIKSQSSSPLLGQSSLSATDYLGTVVGGYRVIDRPAGRLDLMAGTRIMSLNSTVSFSGGLLPGFSLGSGDTWADPLVALRGIAPVAPHLSLFGYGDVGGGPNSDLTWQVYGGLEYSITSAITAYAGYRYLSIRHAMNALDMTEVEQGPMLGLGYQF
jgi:opacity protein-like surface antigen